MDALLGAAHIVPLMATDEEGGEIERLSNVVGALPWPRQMAEQWSTAEVTAQLTGVAQRMRALGMNMDLAPVLDTASSTDTIDDEDFRSFSEVGAVSYTHLDVYKRQVTVTTSSPSWSRTKRAYWHASPGCSAGAGTTSSRWRSHRPTTIA